MSDPSPRALVSVPPGELVGLDLPGSVFDARLLAPAAVSPDLRVALDLIVGDYAARGIGVECVARPEIFTNGPSIAWLQSRIAGAVEHVSLSDGTSVKLIPGVDNLVFPYGLHVARRNQAWTRLIRRVPELIAQFAGQVNAAERVTLGDRDVSPGLRVIMPGGADRSPTLWSYAFYLHRHWIDGSIERMLEWAELGEPQMKRFSEIIYLPLTGTALAQPGFRRIVAEMIAELFFATGTCLLIRLPRREKSAGGAAGAMAEALEAIRDGGLQLPRARAANIFFVSDDPAESFLANLAAPVSVMAPQSWEFWSFSRGFYSKARDLVVFLDEDSRGASAGSKRLYEAAFGRRPQFSVCERNDHRQWVAA